MWTTMLIAVWCRCSNRKGDRDDLLLFFQRPFFFCLLLVRIARLIGACLYFCGGFQWQLGAIHRSRWNRWHLNFYYYSMRRECIGFIIRVIWQNYSERKMMPLTGLSFIIFPSNEKTSVCVCRANILGADGLIERNVFFHFIMNQFVRNIILFRNLFFY